MTMIGSPACPLGRLEGQARGGGEGEGRCRLSSPPPKGATPCDRPPRGAILIPRPLGVVDYLRNPCDSAGSTPGNRDHAMAAWNRLGGRPRRFGGTQGGSGIGWLSHSRIVQRWSVRPAAIAGVRSCHFRRCPVPAAIRRLSWTQQKL